jgi:hypothetical protein
MDERRQSSTGMFDAERRGPGNQAKPPPPQAESLPIYLYLPKMTRRKVVFERGSSVVARIFD